MSRRDTIIVAVLINAGLLIVLFASALKPSGPHASGQEYAASPSPQPVVNSAPAKKETPVVPGDEVDQVLSQYAHAKSSVPVSQPVEPVAPLSQPAPVSFAEDFKLAPLSEPVVASVVEKPTVESTDYKVKHGDVLEKIARHHQCTVDQIMQLNKLSTTNLRIGQALKIPAKAVKKTGVPGVPTEQALKYYTVKNGDNPWTIAVKNHMKVEELLKLNELDEEKARRLKPGDQLKIR